MLSLAGLVLAVALEGGGGKLTIGRFQKMIEAWAS